MTASSCYDRAALEKLDEGRRALAVASEWLRAKFVEGDTVAA